MRTIKIASFCLIVVVITACNTKSKDKSSTKTVDKMEEISTSQSQALEDRKISFGRNADQKTKDIYQDGIDAVLESGILDEAKNVGDIAPGFTLKNAVGKEVSLQDYLQKGSVVLVWYRGGWCPYCNINLHYLQKALPSIKAQGANLVALTPELPDQSVSTSEKHQLEFEVLSDIGNKVANDYGVVFRLSDDVAKIYKEKFNLNDLNGDTSNELPLAATYIIDVDGKIVYAFLDSDYRNRAEPTEIVAFLKEMKE